MSSYPALLTDGLILLLGIANTLLLLSLRKKDMKELHKVEPLFTEVQDLATRVSHLERILGTPEEFQELRSLLTQVSQTLHERLDKTEAWITHEGELLRALTGALKLQQEAFYDLSTELKKRPADAANK